VTSSQEQRAERILCPIRGGKQSARTVDRAIDKALETGAGLTFLYIVDVEFLGYATVARVNLMVEELKETGHFAMSILCEKARARGVEDVDSIIREGSVQDVIASVAAKTGASRLIIGRPVKNPGVKSFSARQFDRMLQSIRETTGLEVESVE
jgi:nucleotide-binding universal stress UspA family protein